MLGAAVLALPIAATAIPSHASVERQEAAAETAYVQAGLASVAEWEERLENTANPLTGIDRRVIAESLLEELTRLCEVNMLSVAEHHLRALLRREESKLTRYGFHPSGLVSANVTRLEVKNPYLQGHTIYLLRLENRTPLDLRSGDESACRLVTTDGRIWRLEELDSGHPLYPHLNRMEARFRIPDRVPAGAVATFELILDRPPVSEKDIAYFLLTFGRWRIVIKFYENI